MMTTTAEVEITLKLKICTRVSHTYIALN